MQSYVNDVALTTRCYSVQDGSIGLLSAAILSGKRTLAEINHYILNKKKGFIKLLDKTFFQYPSGIRYF